MPRFRIRTLLLAIALVALALALFIRERRYQLEEDRLRNQILLLRAEAEWLRVQQELNNQILSTLEPKGTPGQPAPGPEAGPAR